MPHLLVEWQRQRQPPASKKGYMPLPRSRSSSSGAAEPSQLPPPSPSLGSFGQDEAMEKPGKAQGRRAQQGAEGAEI
ncbi:unnamed protein product [Miscanthus lutarioriparius]|uniref:Uncharacterized protein n=1 Tax=Miscanthus lutarioriparius TaxID=422564 RepID=A0A811RT32_9POAL|nr:unnamed protein product [Miscanthus lutarioriparius]